MAYSEMVTSNPALRKSRRTQLKLKLCGEPAPRAIQLLGTDPAQMAEAAQYNVERGAQIIDINMGCPAKKVCNVAAGSALMQNEKLVAQILTAVVSAVKVPVTLKIRTGANKENINSPVIAKIAEVCGIQALTIHGRTRCCGFTGKAEYNIIRKIKQSINLPIIANGDITSPEQAKQVLQFTGADAIMVGRAAQGNPWVFREINHYLQHGEPIAAPSFDEFEQTILEHIIAIHQFYGELAGVRIARKHIGWYFKKPKNSQLISSLSEIYQETKSTCQLGKIKTAINQYRNRAQAA